MPSISLEEGEDWKEILASSPKRSLEESKDDDKPESNNHLWCKNVNRELVAPKCFYLFFFGANGTLIPYLILFFKQLGLTPSQVGIVSGLKPFISFVCSPIWGYVADKTNKTRYIYVISLLAYIGGFLAYSFAPASHVCKIRKNTTALHVSHFPAPFSVLNKHFHKPRRYAGESHESGLVDRVFLHKRPIRMVSPANATNNTRTVHKMKVYDPYQHYYPSEMESALFQVPPSVNFLSNKGNNLEKSVVITEQISDPVEEVKAHPIELSEHAWSSAARVSKAPWTVCAAAKANSADDVVYQTISGIQFNLNAIFSYLLVVTITATIFSCPLITIVDTATIRRLKKNKETHRYGKQRLWGSLGWGICSFVVGSLVATIPLCPGVNNEVSYYPAFYVFTVMQFIALLVGSKLDFNTEAEKQDQMSRTEKISQGLSLLKQPVYFYFIVTSFYIGVVMSIIKTFLFWHLKDIGGTQMLFSTVAVVNCIAEVFVYFFSSTFIERVGHIRVLYIALICYSLRLFYYGLLPNPWYVLAAEPLSGITTAAAWASMTSYVGLQANHESVTTLQGILHGVHWGLGHGIGELIGGFMVSWVGAAMTFNIFGALTIIQLLVFVLVMHLNTSKETEENHDEENS